MKKIFYLTLIILGGAQLAFSQANEKTISEEEIVEKADSTVYRPVDLNVQIKNMHLWRGYRVNNAPVITTDLHYISKNGKFKAGLWGGLGFNGYYHEFDYYVSYTTGGFSFAVWDINNYSDYPDASIFDYDIGKTAHFIDVGVAYNFKKIPLKLSWNTIVLGRDTYVNNSGELKNAFTNYVEASYTVMEKDNWTLGAFVGAAFSFESESNFYGDKTGFNNIGVIYSRNLNILDKVTIPVTATASWNTLQKYGAMQLAVNLF